MTVQEAIEYLQLALEESDSTEEDDSISELYKEMCKTAIEELEKQIPKKVEKLEAKILIADGWQYRCPRCKCAVGTNQHAEEYTQEDSYCPTCGQALKWGEEE